MKATAVLSAPLMESDPRFAEEIALEHEASEAGAQRYYRLAADAAKRGEGSRLRPAEILMRHWHGALEAQCIERRQQLLEQIDKSPGSHVYGPVLIASKPSEVAAIVLHVAISRCMSEPQGMPFTSIAHSVGMGVLAQLEMRHIKNQPKCDDQTLRQRMVRTMKELTPENIIWFANKNLEEPIYHRTITAQVGSVLLHDLAMTTALQVEDDKIIPAFFYKMVPKRGRKIRWFQMDDAAHRKIAEGHESRAWMRPRYQPMVIPPAHWTTDGVVPGGYIQIRNPLISKPRPEQKKAMRSPAMKPTLECLNALTQTGLTVDENILALQEEVWERGGGILGIPRKYDLPKYPAMTPEIEADPDLRKAWRREAAKVYDANVRIRSVRAVHAAKIEVARKFRGRTIYFPHQMDFRGRSYPIPLYLNYHGDDSARGLLQFAKPIPVTSEEGRSILLVHAANCYGVDNVSFAEREQWARDNSDNIARAVVMGLDDEWWQKADEPWQFMQACYALCKTECAARIVIGRDGSANGLQHYAALGRDPIAAGLVNLSGASKPANLYLAVAKKVRSLIEQDIAAGVEVAPKALPFATRPIVKQPVMTHTYGVTMVGAKNQILPFLADAGVPKEDQRPIAQYLANTIKRAMGETNQSAKNIMDYLRELAAVVVKEKGSTMAWSNPIGFPVVQPYRKQHERTVKTIVGCVLTVHDAGAEGAVKVGKQLQAFAPNYIHSIDAAHMMLIAKQCREEGIDFIEVHDSFRCHAENVARMDTIIREKFVEIHSRDLIQELYEDMHVRHPGLEFPEPPAKGNWDVTEVLDSRYAFH